MLAYAVLVVAAFGVVGLIAGRTTADAVEESQHLQMKNTAAMVSRGGFPLGRDALLKIKDLLGVEGIITLNSRGEVIESTFEPPLEGAFAEWLAARPARPGETMFAGAEIGEKKWYMACRSLLPHTRAEPAGRAVLVYPPDVVSKNISKALTPLIITGLAGLMLTLAVGFFLARSIAAPIRRLVDATRRVRGGDFPLEIPALGGPETRELADAIATMAARLGEYREKMIMAEKMATLGTVATSLAHEIKNPLTGIQLSVETLKSRSNDPAVTEEYDVILTEIKRLSFTLSELLIFAKPPEVRKKSVNGKTLINETLSVLARQMQHLGIEAEVDVPDGFPEVSVDPSALKQVLMNLVLNAMEAMPQGGKLTVAAAPGESGWALSVSDTGAGITPAAEEKIFEPFFTTRSGGTGLGLAVCRTLVDLHGGAISAAREDGRTVFYVTFP